jgi:beta-lactamase regulating signal transducer with metallopeptidase domain
MLHYLLQTQIAWLFFYGLYVATLSRETFFRLNRFYLLTTLLLGILLPLIPMVVDFPSSQISPILSPVVGSAVEWTPVFRADTEGSFFSIEKIIFGIYSLGFAVALARFLTGLQQIFRLYKNGEHENWDGSTLIYTEDIHLPFSFFKWIFINPQIIDFADYQHIMKHEQAHVRQRHSVDMLFLAMVGIAFWWSPMVYFYKKSLRNVHEYLADASVLSDVPLPDYGALLLRQADHNSAFPLANHFIFSQLKKRFLMMTRKPSASFATAKYVFAAPIIVLLFVAFAKPDKPVLATDASQFTSFSDVSTPILLENAPNTPVLPKNKPISVVPIVVQTPTVLTAAQPLEPQIIKPQAPSADTSKPEERLTDEQIKKYKIDTTDKPPQAQPGHCYAKCKLLDKLDSYGQWREVVCGDKITDKFIKSLATALREKGYQIGNESANISSEMKKALADFQQKNKLPVGNLNYETMKVLMTDFKDYEVIGPQKK